MTAACWKTGLASLSQPGRHSKKGSILEGGARFVKARPGLLKRLACLSLGQLRRPSTEPIHGVVEDAGRTQKSAEAFVCEQFSSCRERALSRSLMSRVEIRIP